MEQGAVREAGGPQMWSKTPCALRAKGGKTPATGQGPQTVVSHTMFPETLSSLLPIDAISPKPERAERSQLRC